MTARKDIERITQWCEEKKKERKRIHVIERNPFMDEIMWTRRFPLIEIDRPKEIASRNSLVYDSTTKRLWYFANGTWRMATPDF